ncbi:MAG TPA: hypothetical protein VFX98_19935 [Longimicrobiaceae bacterium]|nr:hypothetical protein [Longimicrobiaceae bacterium]
MRASKLWLVMALPLALAACGGGDEGETGDPDNATSEGEATVGAGTGGPGDTAAGDSGMPAAHAPGAMGAATLAALNNSGITGEASLSTQGDRTQVVLNLRNARPSATHQAHIHNGTCEALGQVVAQLTPVQTDATGFGTSTSSVGDPLDRFTGGAFVVAAHVAGGAPGVPVTCGPIQAHQM